MAQGRPADLRGTGVDLTSGASSDGGRSVFAIVNPASGRGRGRRRLRRYLELLKELLPEARHAVTTHAGEESLIAERAMAEGYRTLIAVGGDGTWSHVADRIMNSGRTDVRLALLPSGTGNDFGRSIGVAHREPDEAVRIIARGASQRVDVGRVNSEIVRSDLTSAAPTTTRHFLNLVGFGFDIAVIDAAKRARFLRGELLYKITALQQLFRFPGFDVAVDAEGGVRLAGRHLMLTISNGRYFGGGFPIAPGATVTDHRLHACFIKDASPAERYRLFDLAAKGLHLSSQRVMLVGGKRFRSRFAAPPRFEVDGDVYQASGKEVEVEILPAALEVVMPE